MDKISSEILKKSIWLVIGLIISSCQSVGPTGRAVQRTEPEKSAEELFEKELGANSARRLVGTFGAEITIRHCKLTIPARAVDGEVYVEVALAKDAPQGSIRETAYKISPDNMTFKRPVLLRLHYFDDDLKPGENEEDIVMVKEIGGQWFEIAGFTVDTFNNIASVEINQSGTYALKIGKSGEPLVNIPPIAKLSFKLLTEKPSTEETSPHVEGDSQIQEGGRENISETSEEMEKASESSSPANTKINSKNGGEPKASDLQANGVYSEVQPFEKTRQESPQDGSLSTSGNAKEDTKTSTVNSRSEEIPRDKLVRPEDGEKRSFVIEKAPAEKNGKSAFTTEYKVAYSAEGSTDPDGRISRYSWDFDNDSVFDVISGVPESTKTYLEYGKVLTLLKVDDNHKPPSWDLAYVSVELPQDPSAPRLPLKASATLFPNRLPLGGKLFAGVSVRGGSPPYKFNWEFSSGETSVQQALLISPLKKGNFWAKLTVTDSNGVTVKKELSAEITAEYKLPDKGLKVNISPSTVNLDAPGKVDFTLNVQGGVFPLKIRAETSDGKIVLTEGKSFTFSFENSGYDFLSIAITDSAGQSAKLFLPVRVGTAEELVGYEFGSPAPKVKVEYDNDGQTVKLTATSIPKGAKVTWDFGDGTSQTGYEVKKKYAKADVYRVRQIVDDGFRLQMNEIPIPISGGKLSCAINLAEKVIGTIPFVISPKANVSGGKYPLFFRWTIGDLFSDEERPRFILDKPGSYQLQLSVVDGAGNSFDANPVKVVVYSTPPDYRYPIAFITSSEEAQSESILKLVEFDGASTFTFPLVFEPRKVFLAPGAEEIAIVGESGFSVFHISSLKETLKFLPSLGLVEEVFPTRGGEITYFNLKFDDTEAGTRGYLFSTQTGYMPIGEDSERILDVSANGEKVLLVNDKGIGKVISVDSFSGSQRNLLKLDLYIVDGAIAEGGNSVFLITRNNEVVRINLDTGAKVYLAEDGAAKSNLQASINGDVIGWNLENGELVIFQADVEKDSHSFPVNISEIIGVKPKDWQLSPDGRLLVYYYDGDKGVGLYLIQLVEKLANVATADLTPHFLASSSSEFSVSASLAPFDILIEDSP